MIDSGSGIDARSFKVNNVTQGATYRAIVLGSTESSITAPTIVVEGKKINMLNHTPNASYQVIYNNSNVGNSVNLLSIVDKKSFNVNNVTKNYTNGVTYNVFLSGKLIEFNDSDSLQFDVNNSFTQIMTLDTERNIYSFKI